MPIELIDPVVSPAPYSYTIARRRSIVDAPVIGLVGNGKPNAEEVLRGVADHLEHQLGITPEWITVAKPHASRVMPPDMVNLIARRCHFALVGVGD